MRGLICEFLGESNPPVSPEVMPFFAMGCADLARDAEKYANTCEGRRKAGAKGGLAKASNCLQDVANLANQTQINQAQINQNQKNKIQSNGTNNTAPRGATLKNPALNYGQRKYTESDFEKVFVNLDEIDAGTEVTE